MRFDFYRVLPRNVIVILIIVTKMTIVNLVTTRILVSNVKFVMEQMVNVTTLKTWVNPKNANPEKFVHLSSMVIQNNISFIQ